MKIYIRTLEETFLFKLKTLSEDYFEHETNLTVEELLYYKDYLYFEDDQIKIRDNILPKFENGVTILQEDMRGSYYTFPGYDIGLLRNAAVIPKNSVVIYTEKVPGMILRKSIYWAGVTLMVAKFLEEKIEVKTYGACNYEFI